jgi:hypothetical protein
MTEPSPTNVEVDYKNPETNTMGDQISDTEAKRRLAELSAIREPVNWIPAFILLADSPTPEFRQGLASIVAEKGLVSSDTPETIGQFLADMAEHFERFNRKTRHNLLNKFIEQKDSAEPEKLVLQIESYLIRLIGNGNSKPAEIMHNFEILGSNSQILEEMNTDELINFLISGEYDSGGGNTLLFENQVNAIPEDIEVPAREEAHSISTQPPDTAGKYSPPASGSGKSTPAVRGFGKPTDIIRGGNKSSVSLSSGGNRSIAGAPVGGRNANTK